MTVLANDVFELALHYVMPEDVDAYNILRFFNLSGTATDAQLLVTMAAFVTTAYTTLLGIMSNQVDVADGVLNKIVWTGVKWEVNALVGTILPALTGTDGTDMLPHQCTGLVTFPTLLPRKFGKIHVAGITEANQSDSLLTGGAATALGNFATAMLAAQNPGTAAVYYTISGKGGTSHFPQGFFVRGLMGSQDRRKPGVGI